MSYAKMRATYLETQHPEMYASLQKSGKLEAHCQEIEQEAIERKAEIEDQLLTAQHKADQPEQRPFQERLDGFAEIPQKANEIVLTEIVYAL